MPLDLSRTLDKLRTLAEGFRDAAAQCDLPTMEKILGTRRRLLERISSRGDDAGASAEQRKHVQDILAAILELDREAERLLEKQRDEVGDELVALANGRRGISAYASRRRDNGKWIDEAG
jgi:hypothetical protein